MVLSIAVIAKSRLTDGGALMVTLVIKVPGFAPNARVRNSPPQLVRCI